MHAILIIYNGHAIASFLATSLWLRTVCIIQYMISMSQSYLTSLFPFYILIRVWWLHMHIIIMNDNVQWSTFYTQPIKPTSQHSISIKKIYLKVYAYNHAKYKWKAKGIPNTTMHTHACMIYRETWRNLYVNARVLQKTLYNQPCMVSGIVIKGHLFNPATWIRKTALWPQKFCGKLWLHLCLCGWLLSKLLCQRLVWKMPGWSLSPQ